MFRPDSLPETTVQRSYLNFKEGWNDWDMMCFLFWRTLSPLMAESRGFVIEVKNNKATACRLSLAVQRPWYESNALCMAPQNKQGYRKACGFWSCFPFAGFHLTRPLKLSLEPEQMLIWPPGAKVFFIFCGAETFYFFENILGNLCPINFIWG